MRALGLALVLAVMVATSGCLYTNVHSPRAYRSATPGDVKASPNDPTVSGEGCYETVLYLVSWGDSSYAAATRHAQAGDPTAILYDVKADTKVTSYVLGLYTKICTVVTGRLARP